ncbi:MAG TPA: hypothetical protein VEF04_05820, partial [Blastocatellia bacterium]|nr:hypothetical protein [Blastocatellia bacterium]
YSQHLSKYREFQLGSKLSVIAKQVQMKPSEAKVTHQRPALIQELEWQAQIVLEPTSRTDSVKSLLFSFYNGELFRIVVTYDLSKTEGMTAEDMIEAVSVKYGTATKPAAEILLSSTSIYSDGEKAISSQNEKVIARWEDEQSSVNFIQSFFQTNYGLVVYSKRLDALARSAIAESIRLDEQDSPIRQMERQKQEGDEKRAKQAKARQANKPSFRP